ncbi:MAG: M20/M25/M40 family metallo-hydrolase [Oscillospiraceae bacterium]|nr:M20/M25/M40 family metallo-hydrolase [Oscillospiraceae bacterium]
MGKVNRNRLYETFQELVAIDSPSLGEKKMGAFVKKRLNTLGLPVVEDNAGKQLGGTSGNLYCRWNGLLPNAAPLLFSAHLDTVEPSKGKRAILLQDGTIQGGGNAVLGADDLAGVAVILEALQTVMERGLLHREVELLFLVAEEIYSGGALCFDYGMLHAKEAYVLDLSGPVGSCAYRAPTILAFTAAFKGRAAHAGFAPETGANAIAAAARAISSTKQGHVGTELTVNIGMIQGGTSQNIVSDTCIVHGEIRSYQHESALEKYNAIQTCFEEAGEAFGVTVSFSHRFGCIAYEIPKGAAVVSRAERACKACGIPFQLIQTFGGSDNNHFVQRGLCGVVLACGMEDCHSVKERSNLDELVRAAEIVVRLMIDPV